MHASLPHPHSGPLSVAPSIPTDTACILLASLHPVSTSPLNPGLLFNPLLTSCFCPLHGLQSSTCFSGVHPFFHPSSPAKFPCSCFSLPYFCTFLPTLSISLAPSLYLITLWFVCFPFFHSSFSSRYSSNLPWDYVRMSVQCCPITDCAYVQMLCFQPILTYLNHLELSPSRSDSLKQHR